MHGMGKFVERGFKWGLGKEETDAQNSLLGVVELERKVLPLRLILLDRVQRLAVAVDDFEVFLARRGLPNELARLEVPLVGRVVCRLVPDVLLQSFSICNIRHRSLMSVHSYSSRSIGMR